MSADLLPTSGEDTLAESRSVVPRPKTMSRRTALALAGGGLLILVGGGLVWRAADQGVFSTGEGPAYVPWDNWRTAGKGPLDIVRAAILAANPHNTQPWLFQVTSTQINLFADRRRAIGTIDPFLREMHLGLGCALENLLLAAPANGYSTRLTLFPDPANESWVARIDLAAGPTVTSDLYAMIPGRHTNRFPYDPGRPVLGATLEALRQLGGDPDVRVFWFADVPLRQQVGSLLVEAARALVADQVQDADSARWWRGTWQDVQQHRDGITLDAQGLSDPLRALVKMLPPVSQNQQDATFVQNTATQAETAAAFGLLTVRDAQDRNQQLGAGRVWERMHLWSTREGLALQPLNAAIERAAREVILGLAPHFGMALAAFIGDPGWQTVLAFRIGYPTHDGGRSPRRGLDEVITS